MSLASSARCRRPSRVSRVVAGCVLALSAALPRPSSPAELSGRVLIAPGKPAPAATAIELRRSESDLERAQRLAAGKAEAPPPVVIAHPDASGRFALTAPAGNWVLSVKAAGYVASAMPVLGLVEETELEDVTLAPETHLAVEVRDTRGGAVPGAWVSAKSVGPSLERRGEGPSPWRHLERTDARGVASVSCVKDERLQLTVAGDGRVATSTARCDAGSPQRVPLPADVERTLEVRGAQNEPLAGTVVVETGAYLPLGRTSRDGKVALLLPAEGRTVAVLAAGHAFLQTTVARAAIGETLVVRLEPMPRLSGRVLEARTRRALAGALVWPWANPGAVVSTDARGEFVLADDPSRVLTAAAGHAEGFLRDADTRAPVTIVVEAVLTVKGRVVDVRGQPIGEARVAVQTASSAGRNGMQIGQSTEALSRADGSFRLSGLASETAYQIAARRAGYAPTTVALAPAAPGAAPAPLEIVLGSGNEVTLRVLDGSGNPVPRARGQLRSREPDDPRGRSVYDLASEEDRAIAAESDADGRIRWAHVSAGGFDALVKARGFAALRLPGVQVDAPSAKDGAGTSTRAIDLGTVRLVPGVALSGVAVDPAGAPLGGIAVWVRSRQEILFGSGFREPDTTTAGDGTFTLDDLTPGDRVNVLATGEGRTDAQAEGVLLPTESPLRLVLPPRSRLRGRVVDLEGKPVAGVELRRQVTRRTMVAIFSRSGSTTATSGDDGTFVFDDVPAGSTQVFASRDGYQSALSGELEIPVGKDLDGVELVLRPGAAIAGRVLDADGEAVADVTVSVQGERSRWDRLVMPVQTDGDGRYRLSKVPLGLQTVVAESDDGGRAAQEIKVELGENALDFRLARGFEVSGTVTDERGRPVGGAQVQLFAADRRELDRPHDAVSAADGTFLLRGIDTGRVSLQARAAGYSDASLGPLSVEGSMSGLALKLGTGTGNISGALRGLDLRDLGSADIVAHSTTGSRRGVVEARGSYRVSGVAPGEWTVQATVDNGRRRARGTALVVEGATETTLDLDFSGGFALSGRVTRNGQPSSGVFVLAISEKSASFGSAQTDAEGRFRMEGLAAGTYNLTVHRMDVALHNEAIELSEDRDVAIAITTGAVRGRVVDAADNTPLAGARVRLEPFERHPDEMFSGGSSAITDSKGDFVLDDALAGRWKVTASLDGYATGSSPVDLAEGADASLDVALERSDGVALELSRPGAQTVDVAVLAQNGALVFGGSFVSTDSGRVRLSTLPLGTYRIVLAVPGSAVAVVTATAPGPPVPVALVPEGRVILTLPALMSSGGAAEVTLHSDSQGTFQLPRWSTLQSSWTASNGRLELGGVPPGSWTVYAAGAGPGQSWSANFAIRPGETLQIEVK